MPPLNHREFERISTERPVTIQSNDTSNQAKMIDLSQHGAGILSTLPLIEGTEISIYFKLPTTGNATIKLNAVAIHNQKVRGLFLVGIEFKNMVHAIRHAIDEYIQFHHRLD